MKNYKAPELEIVKFSHEDIMLTSGVGGGEGGSTPAPGLNVPTTNNGTYEYESLGGVVKYGTFIQ